MTVWTPWGVWRSRPPARASRWRGRATQLIALPVAMFSAACGALTVNQINADPSKYRNRDVKLSGEVVDSYSLLNQGVYRIDDGTGQLWVISNKGVPRKSARVTVKGKVREGFTLGSLGDRLPLPHGIGTGVVLTESSHSAKD